MKAEGIDSYSYSMVFTLGTSWDTVREMSTLLETELRKRGFTHEVLPRQPKDPLKMESYISVKKLNKKLAAARIAELKGLTPENTLILGDFMYLPVPPGPLDGIGRAVYRVAEEMSGASCRIRKFHRPKDGLALGALT